MRGVYLSRFYCNFRKRAAFRRLAWVWAFCHHLEGAGRTCPRRSTEGRWGPGGRTGRLGSQLSPPCPGSASQDECARHPSPACPPEPSEDEAP